LCGALLAALWSLTWQQAHIYANPETLWQATLARNPSAWIAHSNLGWDLLRAGRPEAAIPHFEAALRIGPGAHEVENNWGLALVLLGRPETEAERHFLASLHLNPQFGNAHYNYANLLFRTGRLEAAVKHYRAALRSPVRDTSLDPALHNNFGSALAQLGRFDEAAVQYQQSLRLRSDGVAWKNLGTARLDQGRLDDAIQCLQASLQFTNSADIHLDLALAFKAKGNGEQAAAHFAEALRLDPGSAAAHFQFGLFLYQQHRPAETLAHWREALKLKPDSPDLLNGLAWILATCPDPKRRDGAQAVQFAERASTLSGSPASSLDTLAAAYAEAGRFTDAVAAAQKALALAEATGQTNTLARFRSRLQLYRQHIAYHEANEP
jgi:tetratricopeptide (TPR) repeat protein